MWIPVLKPSAPARWSNSTRPFANTMLNVSWVSRSASWWNRTAPATRRTMFVLGCRAALSRDNLSIAFTRRKEYKRTMGENGTDKRSSIWSEVAGQISDHVDLASLELRYETEYAGKKLLACAIVLILVLTGFIVLQVALVGALM